MVLTASLFQDLTMSNLKTVPKIALTTDSEYPYRQGSGEYLVINYAKNVTKITSASNFTGEACFVCESDHDLGDIGLMTTSDCPRCSPTITLDLSQCYVEFVLEHSPSVSVCSRPFSALLSHSFLLSYPSPSLFVPSVSVLCFRHLRPILFSLPH